MAKRKAKPFDTTFKELVQRRPLDALTLARVRDALEVQVVDAELSTVVSAADKVLQVRCASGKFLVHFEFQSGPDRRLLERIFWYNSVLFHRHRLPVLSVLVLLTPEADSRRITGEFKLALPDGRACVSLQYEIVRLWQMPVEAILTGPVGLLPLVPLCRGAEDMRPIMPKLQQRIDSETTHSESDSLWSAIYFLAGLRGDAEAIVQMIPRGVAMRESTTYQATLEEGRVEGRIEGRVEGLVEGQLEGARRFFNALAIAKLGAPNATARARIEAIEDLGQYEQLGVRLLCVESWEDLLSGLEPVSRKTRKRKA